MSEPFPPEPPVGTFAVPDNPPTAEEIREHLRHQPKPTIAQNYNLQEAEFWKTRYMPAGSVIVFPAGFVEESGQGNCAVLVKSKETHGDSMWLKVRCLGTEEKSFHKTFMDFFKKGKVRVHLCYGEAASCPELGEEGCHIDTLQWYPPGDFDAKWITSANRKVVKDGVKLAEEELAREEAAAPRRTGFTTLEDRLRRMKEHRRVTFGGVPGVPRDVRDAGEPVTSGAGRGAGRGAPESAPPALMDLKIKQEPIAVLESDSEHGDKRRKKKRQKRSVEDRLAKAVSERQHREVKKEKRRSRSRSLRGRRHSRKRRRRRSRSSSNSERSQSEDSQSSLDSLVPPLKKKAQRDPGSVLRLLESQAMEQLAREGVTEEEYMADSRDGRRPKIFTFFQLALKPSLDPKSRDCREISLLARCLDMLREGRLANLADTLAARLLAASGKSRRKGKLAKAKRLGLVRLADRCPPKRPRQGRERQGQERKERKRKGCWRRKERSGGEAKRSRSMIDDTNRGADSSLGSATLNAAAPAGSELVNVPDESTPSFESSVAGSKSGACQAAAGRDGPAVERTREAWLERLKSCMNLAEVGVALAWGLNAGFLPFQIGSARPTRPAGSRNRTRGLFPLSVEIPAEIKNWSSLSFSDIDCSSFFELAVSCWREVSCAALNAYYGCRVVTTGVRAGKMQAAVKSSLEDRIGKFLKQDSNFGFCFDDVRKDLKEKRVSYTGEEVSQPLPLSVEQIIPGLPPRGHGASVPVEPFVTGRTKYLLEHPYEALLDPSEQGDAPCQAKVHIRAGESLKVFELLKERGIIDWVPADVAYKNSKGTYLNGLFGVVKQGRFTATQQPVLRVIMNLIPVNSILAVNKGDISFLPSPTAWIPICAENGEVFTMSQGDMQSAFYLFRMPKGWEPFFCFNFAVSGEQVGLAAGQQFRPCCKVLPMGWSSSVGIMQQISRQVLLMSGLPSNLEIQRVQGIPRWFTQSVSAADQHRAWWQVYLDNFMSGESSATTHPGIGRLFQENAMRAWSNAGILTADDKQVLEQQSVVELGIRFDGNQNLLAASTERVFRTILATFHIVSGGRWSKKETQVVLGRWIFILQFRRAGMACLSRAWESLEGMHPTHSQRQCLNQELFMLVCLSTLLQTDLSMIYDNEVTCSDASEYGGAVAKADQLTWSGRSYVDRGIHQELGPVACPVLVISFFNGIGGSFRIYDILGIKPMGLISIEINKECNRVTRVTWPQVEEYGDINLLSREDVKQWANSYARAVEIHAWAGFPCVHLSSVRAFRENLYGEGSNLFWKLLEVLGWIQDIFSTFARVKFCIENVASMDESARRQISSELEVMPVKLDPADCMPISRPRLAWCSETLYEMDGIQLWEEGDYVRAYVDGPALETSQWIRPGWSWPGGNQNVKFPTFMKSIKRSSPPPVPAGYRRATPDMIARWTEDCYRFPPYQYADKFLLHHPTDGCRLLDSSERELLLGFGAQHTSSCMSASNMKKSYERYEDVRRSLCGDSFAILSFAVMGAVMCSEFVPRMAPQQILQRLGLAPGATVHPQALVPMTRWLAYGGDPSSPSTSQMLVKQLGLSVNHTGADVRVCTGAVLGLHYFWPQVRGELREAWRLFKHWRRVEAPSRAPPLTVLLVRAIISRAVQLGDICFAALIALAYHTLLRTGEMLSLRFCDLEFDSRCGIVSLQQSKSGLRTGSQEAIAIRDTTTLQLLDAFWTCHRHFPGQKLWNASAQAFRNKLNAYFRFFRVCHFGYKGYSLRRGGATFLLQEGVPLEAILLRGRWKSIGVGRLYLQDGLAQLPSLRIPPCDFDRCCSGLLLEGCYSYCCSSWRLLLLVVLLLLHLLLLPPIAAAGRLLLLLLLLLLLVVRQRWELDRAQKFWEKRNVERPMERILYHFQQHGMHLQELDCAKLFNTSTAIGALYAGAFAAEASKPLTRSDSKEAAKFYRDNPFMKSVNHEFQGGLPCKQTGPPALPTLPPDFGGKKVCRIFTLWEYPEGGVPVFKLLNIENVKEWIPDMPDEYFRMPSPAPKSDLIRYALLYHHGGLYMDADFVAVKDMDPILALLETHDFISYQEKGQAGQACSAAFSSNLIGGRKGSLVHKYIWEQQKEKMQVRCVKGVTNQACCYDSKKVCNVPWASLGEGVSHPAYNDLLRTGDIFETFCFADEWTFVPDHFAYSVEHIPSKDEALKYMTERGIQKPLDRIVYHLFNAITPLKTWKCMALLDPRRLMGYLYTESFKSENGRRPVARSEESTAWLKAHPEFTKYQQVYNGWQPCPGPVGTTPEPTAEIQEEAAGGCKIFTLWEYKAGPPLSVAINLPSLCCHDAPMAAVALHPRPVVAPLGPLAAPPAWRQRNNATGRPHSAFSPVAFGCLTASAVAFGSCQEAKGRRRWRAEATGKARSAPGFLQKLRLRHHSAAAWLPWSLQEMKKYGTAMAFSYSFLGTLNMCVMVAISWPLFIMRTGGSPILFSPLKLNPKYALYLTGVYFTFGSCATPFLLAASVGLAPFFAKLLSALQKRLKCPKWLAFFLLGLLMAACYVMALPLFITLACRCEPVLINDENVLTYLPDMPKEYFRMPYSQAKSDIIRYGLLYHHGGIYMDTDFLVVKDLDEILTLIRSFDLVSYVDEGGGSLEKGACSRHFSSNFMASRKGSSFMKAVWEKQKHHMVTHCPLSERELEKVCCFDSVNVDCHIPWAGLLVQSQGIGEGVSHKVFDELEGEGIHFKSYCFADDRGFTPPDMITLLDKSADFATRAWKQMGKATSRDPWGRIMYHTFNSIMPWSGYSCKQIFNQSSVYGKLNYLSYTTGKGAQSLPATEEYLRWLKKYKMKRLSDNSDGLPCS
eukprot:s313_g23.t2